MTNKSNKRKGGALGRLISLPFYLAGGWIAYSHFFIDHALDLPPAIEAERITFASAGAGRLSYYADRSAAGRPLVLIHAVNAAASAFEMRPLFDHYRGDRPVYALDLPGYGFSERAARDYTPELYAQAITQFLDSQVAQAADVITLSLSSEFTARAALARPELFHSLAFISPSGLTGQQGGRRSQKISRQGNADRVHAVLAFPLWGRALFDLVSSRRSIDFFLVQSFAGPPERSLADYGYLTAHQPGAEHVPLHFLSGRLFTPDAAEKLYAPLQVPTLALYDQDAYVDFEGLPAILVANSKWQAQRIAPTRGLPHFEMPIETTAALDSFWAAL